MLRAWLQVVSGRMLPADRQLDHADTGHKLLFAVPVSYWLIANPDCSL
jgi:hypothetical protein